MAKVSKETALRIFGGLASSYDRVLDGATLLQDRYWKAWLATTAAPRRGERVLDIGCGTCVLEQRLVAAGGAVVGVDMSVPMLRAGAAKRIRNVELASADAESLPFPDSSFDLVVSCYVPKYTDLRRFTSEASRVLRTGGRVVVYDFVRPEGLLLPVLAFYEQGMMRAAGGLLGLAKRRSAYTFQRLPGIVEGAVWHKTISSLFAEAGTAQLSLRRLSGGVVACYHGIKRPAQGY